MKRDFRNPIWYNEDKDSIACEIAIIDDDENESLHNGRVNKFSNGEQINPDWTIIFELYSVEDVDKLTEEFDKIQKERIEERARVEEEERTRHKEREAQEKLFARKLEIFELPEIKESNNRAIKSKIRKAKSELEVMVHAAKLIIEDETKKQSEE